MGNGADSGDDLASLATARPMLRPAPTQSGAKLDNVEIKSPQPERWINMIHECLQGELIAGEQVLWSGQPERMVFRKRDILEWPFGVFWLAFSIFWMFGASGNFDNKVDKGSPWFALFGIPFVLIGLYLVLGKFFYRFWRRSRTYFAVTDKRVLVIMNTPRKSCMSAYLESLAAITKSIGRNGIGTLRFGNPLPTYARWWAISLADESADGVPTFYDIRDAEMVFRLASELREKTARVQQRFGIQVGSRILIPRRKEPFLHKV